MLCPVPALLYGIEKLAWYEYNKFKVKAVVISFLRCICDIKSINWIRNELVKNLFVVAKIFDEKVNGSVLSWYCHVVKLNEA